MRGFADPRTIVETCARVKPGESVLIITDRDSESDPNITLGGNIKSAIHYDLLMWGATIELDGKAILERGDLKI